MKICKALFLKISVFAFPILLFCNAPVRAQFRSSTKGVYPVNDLSKIKLLNGNWKFKFINSGTIPEECTSFYTTNYNDASWGKIPVPGCWETNAVVSPTYAKIGNYNGLYRMTFKVPKKWSEEHIFIRLEGVQFGYDLYINGQLAGTWESSYNPCQMDITPYIKGSDDNVLAMRVYTQPKGYKFDTNDDWALTGIHRSISIFPVPDTHLKDLTVVTDIIDNNKASINLKYKVSNFSNSSLAHLSIKGILTSPTGTTINTCNIPVTTEDVTNTVYVINPELWNAETPSLYSLKLFLLSNKDTLQKFTQKIGIRKIVIKGSLFTINGVAVKLRGVTVHETHPLLGRAITRDIRLKDLDLMKKANINFIRTSHYPPNEEFINLCDSMGFYVMDEVPFGFGDEWLRDTSYLNILLTRADATVTRDKNHASVIIWSIGNENDMTPITDSTGLYVKHLDPTRPICYPQLESYFKKLDFNIPSFVDIFAPHYPSVSTIKTYAQRSTRPLIPTEYAHSLGLAFEGQKDIWDVIENSSNLTGGCIWAWVDQCVLQTGKWPGTETKATSNWISPTQYYDNNGNQGNDGILYADRNPQVDYWVVRKNYAQVVIAEDKIPVHPGKQTIDLTLKNKYDFINLKNKVSCKWTLTKDKDSIQHGNFIPDIAAHTQGLQNIAITIPGSPVTNVYLLHFDFYDKDGRNLYNHVIQLIPVSGKVNLYARLTDINPGKVFISEKTALFNKVYFKSSELGVNKNNGMIYLKNNENNTPLIQNGPFLRIGRKTTMADDRNGSSNKSYSNYILKDPIISNVGYTETDHTVMISETGSSYNAPDFSMNGNISFEPSDTGWINVKCDFAPSQTVANKYLLDAGVSFLLDSSITEFRWLGYGPYPSYPGKSTMNEYGMHHLNSTDLYFQGNRNGVSAALLTDPAGNGIAIICDSCNIDVDKTKSGLLVSYNAKVSGKGTKFDASLTRISVNTTTHIAANFKIIPVKANQWPALFKAIYKNNETIKPFTPFIAGYDYYTLPNDYSGILPQWTSRITAQSYSKPNYPVNISDNDLNTKWSANGMNPWIQYEYYKPIKANELEIAFSDGDKRKTTFSVLVSKDTKSWTTILNKAKSKGNSKQPETFQINPSTGIFFRIIGNGGNPKDSVSISEANFIYKVK